MELRRILLVAFCSIFECEHEYPSDPLQGERLVTDRSGRDNRLNEVLVSQNVILHVQNGQLEGYVMKTIKDRDIFAFEGIPFAEDTGGENRFQPPIPKGNWRGIRDAKSPSAKCLQVHLVHVLQVVGSEDCLSLNVYTPELPARKKQPNLPVLVFFHGGSWFFGSGSEYGPAYLLEHDVILVTVNYRLGVLGFLSTDDETLPGNLGLKDQSLSLTWVQQNIRAFGGNPAQVTIAGQSSGAASVHLHMMSPLSRGKFIAGISLSGNAFSSWAFMNSKTIAHRNRKIARASSCPVSPNRDFVNCLKKLSGRKVASLLVSAYDMPLVPTVPLSAVIERNVTGAFITASPDELYRRNEVAQVPWITSRLTNESDAIFSVFNLVGLGKENWLSRPLWKRFAPIFMDYKFTAENPDEITRKATEFYTRKNKFPTEGNVFSEMSTDRIFAYGVHKGIQLHSQLAPTYSWLYGYQARETLIAQLGEDPKRFGVTHTDDLTIYFNMSEYYPGYRTTDPEYAVVKLMTSMIANFAITGKPLYTNENGVKVHILDVVEDPKRINVLSINDEVKMIPEPQQNRFKFWESLGLSDMKPFIPIV